jgi:hypothetical protein
VAPTGPLLDDTDGDDERLARINGRPAVHARLA